jgi:hypothetical protein
MKVVFLDIDGVLNCSETPNPRDLPYIVDKRLLRRLLRVTNACKAKIVLTSSWRVDPIGLYAARYWGIPYFDVCPHLPGQSRRKEIRFWLAAHTTVTRFAILDNEDDGLDGLPLFQPAAETGLTAEVAKALKQFLEGKTDDDKRASAARRAIQKVSSIFKRSKD